MTRVQQPFCGSRRGANSGSWGAACMHSHGGSSALAQALAPQHTAGPCTPPETCSARLPTCCNPQLHQSTGWPAAASPPPPPAPAHQQLEPAVAAAPPRQAFPHPPPSCRRQRASLPAPAAEEGLPRQCGTAALCPRRSGGQKAWTAELAQQAENSPLTCRPVPAPDVQPWTHPLTQSHDTRTAGQRPKGNRPLPSAAAVPPYCRDRPQGFCLCLLCFLLPPPLQVRLAADQQQSRRPRAPS